MELVMIPLKRTLLSSLMLLAVSNTQAQPTPNIYLQGGAQPGATVRMAWGWHLPGFRD